MRRLLLSREYEGRKVNEGIADMKKDEEERIEEERESDRSRRWKYKEGKEGIGDFKGYF